jgi:hypothetical protein
MADQQEVTVRGIHYPQEDAPNEIGAAIPTWLEELRSLAEIKNRTTANSGIWASKARQTPAFPTSNSSSG